MFPKAAVQQPHDCWYTTSLIAIAAVLLQVQSVPVDIHQRGLWRCLPGPQPDGPLHGAGGGGQHMDRGAGHPAGEEEQAHGAGAVCAQQVRGTAGGPVLG